MGVATVDARTWTRLLRTAAIALVISTALAILGQVIYVLSFPGSRLADRLDLMSQIATPTLGVLVAAAAVLSLAARRGEDPDVNGGDSDWVGVAVAVLGAVLVLAAAYSIIRLVSIHVPSTGATGQGARFSIPSGDWSARVGQSLLRAAGGVLGGWATWVALTTMVFADRVVRTPAA